MQADLPPAPDPERLRAHGLTRPSERAASVVEYVGLGAVSSMLVSGIAAALDSTVGDRLGATIIRKLLAAVSGTG